MVKNRPEYKLLLAGVLIVVLHVWRMWQHVPPTEHDQHVHTVFSGAGSVQAAEIGYHLPQKYVGSSEAYTYHLEGCRFCPPKTSSVYITYPSSDSAELLGRVPCSECVGK